MIYNIRLFVKLSISLNLKLFVALGIIESLDMGMLVILKLYLHQLV